MSNRDVLAGSGHGTENPLSPGRLDLKSNRSEWFESTSERTMNECGKSSSIVVLLLIDSGFG